MPKHRALPPLAELRKHFDYDPVLGSLIRKVDANYNASAGAEAGWKNALGYICVNFKGTTYLVHRICWYMFTGKDPSENVVDHINGDKSDNRFKNLRACSQWGNSVNRRGVKGYTFCKFSGRWKAQLRVKGKRINLGRFNTKEEAAAAYQEAATAYFGEFAPAKKKPQR